MATVTPTVTRGLGDGDGSLIQYQWTLTSANSDGAGIQCPEWADVTWVATGTWGGATLKPQAVSYSHLTLPTHFPLPTSAVAVTSKNKTLHTNNATYINQTT